MMNINLLEKRSNKLLFSWASVILFCVRFCWRFSFWLSNSVLFSEQISFSISFWGVLNLNFRWSKVRKSWLFRGKKMRVLLVKFGAKTQNTGYPLWFVNLQQIRLETGKSLHLPASQLNPQNGGFAPILDWCEPAGASPQASFARPGLRPGSVATLQFSSEISSRKFRGTVG